MMGLPMGWTNAHLSEICHIEMGQSPPSTTYNIEGSGLPFLQGKAEFGDLYPNPIKYCSHPSKIAKAGAVLLSIRAPVGPTNMARQECCIGRGLAAISPLGSISDRFVLWALRHHEPTLGKLGTGSTFSAISKAQVVSIPIKLPPLSEQRRIVEKIESLFDEIDKGVESLQAAKSTLDLYRKSLLKSAFEGRLTADWRTRNPDKLEDPNSLLTRIRKEREATYQASLADWERAVANWKESGEQGKKPTKPKRPKEFSAQFANIQVNLPDLPFGWTWSHLGWSSIGPEYGTAAKSSDHGDVPVIRMGNLQSGGIDWQNLVYSSNKVEIEQYSLNAGDVLFNRTNSPELVGKSAIYCGEQPALFAGYIVRVNQIEKIASGRYLSYFLNSPIARAHGNTVKTDGVNQSNINSTKLQEYPFPYCSIAEQAQIVAILNTRIEAAGVVEKEIDTNLARTEVLRQSILKQAFSGQLVSQDPNDEPATALLDRIKAERTLERRKTAPREPKATHR